MGQLLPRYVFFTSIIYIKSNNGLIFNIFLSGNFLPTDPGRWGTSDLTEYSMAFDEIEAIVSKTALSNETVEPLSDWAIQTTEVEFYFIFSFFLLLNYVMFIA